LRLRVEIRHARHIYLDDFAAGFNGAAVRRNKIRR